MNRLYLGFLLAPLPPSIAIVSFEKWASPYSGGQDIMLIFGLAFCYMAIVTMAAPAYFWIARRTRVRWYHCLLSGAGIGFLFPLLVGLVIRFFQPDMSGYSAGDGGGQTIINGHTTLHGYVSQLMGAGAMGLFGMSIGFCFWLIALSPACRRCKMAHG